MTKPAYQQTPAALARELGVNPAAGLSTADVHRRLEQYGHNRLEQKHKISPWQIFFSQFQDTLIIILIVVAVISFIIGMVEEHGNVTEGLLIFGIVFAIAIVGFLNEYKAEKTVEALRKLVAQRARVRRGGNELEVDSADIVPGDVVILEEGQKVPADIRLFSIISLQANEASLTGESNPVSKSIDPIPGNPPLGDQRNMLFSGTILTAGKGEGVVTATASGTQIGQIATLVDEAQEEETPMQKKLDKLGVQLGRGVLVICALVFFVIFFLDKELFELSFIQRLILAFTAAVALAVAAIPEGLAFVVRISLALGARRMAAKHALVRKLSAVEALGSTDIICSDKTGTLTRGEMTVRELWLPGTAYQVTGSGYQTTGAFQLKGNPLTDLTPLQPLLQVGALCNNARVQGEHVVGDPTEGALLVSAAKAKLSVDTWKRVGEVPFTSDRKLMSTVHSSGKSFYVATKGATEMVLSKCTHALINGQVKPLTAALKQQAMDQNTALSGQALRVLGFAYKEAKSQPQTNDQIESDLIFAGLQAMMDPPRVEIKEVIKAVTGEAGMRVIMITGDFIETAKAVAAEIGITGEAISGPELDQLSQAEFEKRVETISIYARVNPEHKMRIVSALKKHGHQVAMTGDGVNDAPAIKAADIGIAMGITGTDVSKEASDLILLDDQFLTIVSAVEEGRGIFDNVRKFVNYLISANISEVIVIVLGVLFWNNLVLTAVQLLFINIVTDGLPAIALGSDPAQKGIMKFKPARFQTGIINKRLWAEMFIFGILMAIAVLFEYSQNLATYGQQYAVSVAFTAVVVMEMVRLISIRSDYKVSWRANPWLMVAIASSLALQLLVIYFEPAAKIFGVVPVRLEDWAYILATSVALFVAMKGIDWILDRVFPELATPEPRAPKRANSRTKRG